MRSGKKNCLVDIYQNTIASKDPLYNTSNYTATIWKAEIFCNAVPRRGREVESAGQIIAETYMKFEFEQLDVEGLTELMFIRHNDVDYEIKAILRDLPMQDWCAVDTVAIAPRTRRQ